VGLVSVRPESPANTHHISLSGLGRTYGLRLERGAKSVIEAPISPSNIERGGGVKKFGDFDPNFAHIEIRSWDGGRGGEFLSDDPTMFYDGYGWSLTPGMFYQAPQWWWGEFNGPSTAASTVAGAEAADNFMPGALRSSAGYNVKWYSMASTTHLARSFVQQGSSYAMQRIQTWVRKIGAPPAALTIRIVGASTASGGPGGAGAESGSATLVSTTVEPLESFVWTASLSTVITQAGTTTITWWAEVYTSVAGTDANHWEIAYNTSAGVNSSAVSGNGTSGGWSAASTANFYFRVSQNATDRRLRLFNMDRAVYAVEEKADASTGTKLWINGDRGICSSGTPGSTSAINDSSKVWATSRWQGARVAIIRGTGAGQDAEITANGTTSLTVSLAVAPTSISEYVIYDTNEWTRLGGTIISSLGDNPVKDVSVGNGQARFAYGASTVMASFLWGTSVHQAGKHVGLFADVLDSFSDPVSGLQIVRGISSLGQVSRADEQGITTALTFSSGVSVGGTEYPFTNLIDYNDQMYAFKEDSIWTIKNDRAAKLNIGLDGFPSSYNGRAVAAQNLFLYFSWSHSIERMQSGTVDDIGLWRGAGLKTGHAGPTAALVPYIAWTLAGVDAGSTGRSAAFAWNGRGWNEFWRAHSTGARLQDMIMQSNPGTNPRLWMSVGGELICQRWPLNTLNPRNDPSIRYQHEAVFETGTIDMNAVQLPKLFSRVYAVSKNLASTQATIHCEYQLDDNIGTTAWTPIDNFRRSPIDSLNIRRGNKHSIRLRARALTQVSTVNSELHALTLKSLARIPVRRQWSIRAVTGDFQVDQQGLDDADPDDFYLWLQDAAVSAEPILMRSAWRAMDDTYVSIEHPTLNRLYTTPDGNWGGQLSITIRELEED